MRIIEDGIVDGTYRDYINRDYFGDEVHYDRFVNERDPLELAILELEGEASTLSHPGPLLHQGEQHSDLALAAIREVYVRCSLARFWGYSLTEMRLEAAAILRDGWRPEGWS